MLSHCLQHHRGVCRLAGVLVVFLFANIAAHAQFEDLRLGLNSQSRQNGVEESVSDVRAFIPLTGDGFVTFLDTRLLLADTGDTIGYNLGGGFRYLFPQRGWIWGLNAFTDQRETAAARYRQIGFGAEMQFDWLEMYGNVYLPIGQERTWFGTNKVGSGGSDQLVFAGNHLIFGRTFSQQTELEQALRGFDFEFGGKLFDDINDSIEINGYLGVYGFDNPDLEDIFGASARLNVNASDSVDLNLGVQHDEFFGTQATFGLTVYSNVFFRRSRPPRNSVRDRMNDPVNRRGAMVIARGAVETTPDFFGTPLTNPDSSEMRFVHVDSNAAAGGDGTFENPLNSVAEVNVNSQAGDNVYLYAGSVFDGQGALVLREKQRLFGEGDNFTHTIDSFEKGTVKIPDVRGSALARAVIQNSTGRGIELASGSSVTNVSVINSANEAIWGNNVTEATIADSSFSTTANGTHALSIEGASAIDSYRNEFETSGFQAFAFTASGQSQAQVFASHLSTSGFFANGLDVNDTASVTLKQQSEIETSGILSAGIQADGQSSVFGQNGLAITTTGQNGYGVSFADSATGEFVGQAKVATSGQSAFGILTRNTSNVTFSDGAKVSTTGIAASGITSGDSSIVELDNTAIAASGEGAFGIRSQASSSVTVKNDSLVGSKGVNIAAIRVENGSSLDIENSEITGAAGDEIHAVSLRSGSVSQIRIKNNVVGGGAGTIVLAPRIDSTLQVIGAANANEVATDNGLDASNVTTVNTVTFTP